MKVGVAVSVVKSAYVIKSWSASNRMDGDGNYINIEGRAGGILSWILNLLGVSPTVGMKVRADRIIFFEGSLEGTASSLTPWRTSAPCFTPTSGL